MRKILLYTFLFLLGGCATNLNTHQLLAKDAHVTPVDIDSIKSQDWFDSSKHSVKKISINHKDGVQTRGLHLSVSGSKNVVLYFGGNGFRIQDAGRGLSRRFAELGLDFVWIDYRGLGASDGSPSIASLKHDAEDTLEQYVRGLDKNIIVHGTSMGSLIAANLASKSFPVKALVLEAAIKDIDSLVKEMAMPWQDVQIEKELTTLSSEPLLRQYKGPLLFLVGEKDTLTPEQNARELLAVSPSNQKQLVVIKGASHVDAMVFDETITAYANFINQITNNG